MSAGIDFRAVAEGLLAAHPTSSVYFLIDHAGMPGLHRRLRGQLRAMVKPVREQQGSERPGSSPFLVLAGRKGRLRIFRDLFAWIGANGTYSSSVVLLTSPLDMANLRRRLAARLDATLSENMEAMLRFYDPRVLESLFRILPAVQARTFFSVAESWAYVDRAGKLASVATTFDPEDNFIAPLVLGEKEEFALLESCEIDQVLDLLRQNVPALMATLPLAEQSTFVDRAIGMARQHGVDAVYKFCAVCSRWPAAGGGVCKWAERKTSSWKV